MIPVGPSTTRVASSSSSNQTATAARAALCQVCRLENPSSNSPIRFAASSATPLTASASDRIEPAALPQQQRRREVVGEPDALEIGGEEEPGRSEDVVAVGVIEVAGRVCRTGCAAAASAASSRSPSAPSVASSAARSASQRCCQRAQARSCRLAAMGPAAGGAAVGVADSRGRTRAAVPSLGTDARRRPTSRALCVRDLGRIADHGAGSAPRVRSRQRARDRAHGGPSRAGALEPLRRQHRRTPSRAQRTGSSRMPSSRAAAIAGAGSSGPEEEHRAAGARARRLAAEHAGLHHRALEASHLRGAHPGVERLLQPPVCAQQRAHPGEVSGQERGRHRLGDPADAVERARHRGIAPLVGAPSPARSSPRRTGMPRCSRAASAARGHRRMSGSSVRGSTVDVGVAEGEAEEAAVGRGELVLPAAGYAGLDALRAGRRDRRCSRRSGDSPRAAARAATSATSMAPELPSPLPGGASDRVHQRAAARRQQAQAGAQQRAAVAAGKLGGVGQLDLLIQVLRHQPIARCPRRDLRVGEELDRRRNHHAARRGWSRAGHRSSRRRDRAAPARPRAPVTAPPTSRAPWAARPGDPSPPPAPCDSCPAVLARDRETRPAPSPRRSAAPPPGSAGAVMPASPASGPR